MFKVSKLTDYGTMLMTEMAHQPQKVFSAAELAKSVHLTSGTVSKLLKILAKQGLLTSYQGKSGGYRLSKRPEHINLAEVISALEGPIAITECSEHDSHCDIESLCHTRRNWQKINQIIYRDLSKVSLAEMLRPIVPLPAKENIILRA